MEVSPRLKALASWPEFLRLYDDFIADLASEYEATPLLNSEILMHAHTSWLEQFLSLTADEMRANRDIWVMILGKLAGALANCECLQITLISAGDRENDESYNVIRKLLSEYPAQLAGLRFVIKLHLEIKMTLYDGANVHVMQQSEIRYINTAHRRLRAFYKDGLEATLRDFKQRPWNAAYYASTLNLLT